MALKRYGTQTRTQEVTQPEVTSGDAEALEQSLRPRALAEYIGQPKLKEHLQIHIRAATSRSEPLGHTLLHGPPGLGKTTLAHIIAQEMSSQIRITSGPAIEKAGDLASLLTNLQSGDVLFIDEIHRLRPQIEEVLYSAMEDCLLDIMIGKGPAARSVRLNLQPFTLIGATTKAGSMSAPLRDRFHHQFKLGFYAHEEMCEIASRSAQILGMDIERDACMMIAKASRATPRIGNRLLRSVRDFAHVRDEERISNACVEATLASLDINDDGLDATDRALLETIIDTFSGGPVGLSNLAAILAEAQETIEDVYEPFLMQQGYIQRTLKGRMATKKAYEKMGKIMPESPQAALL